MNKTFMLLNEKKFGNKDFKSVLLLNNTRKKIQQTTKKFSVKIKQKIKK